MKIIKVIQTRKIKTILQNWFSCIFIGNTLCISTPDQQNKYKNVTNELTLYNNTHKIERIFADVGLRPVNCSDFVSNMQVLLTDCIF